MAIYDHEHLTLKRFAQSGTLHARSFRYGTIYPTKSITDIRQVLNHQRLPLLLSWRTPELSTVDAVIPENRSDIRRKHRQYDLLIWHTNSRKEMFHSHLLRDYADGIGARIELLIQRIDPISENVLCEEYRGHPDGFSIAEFTQILKSPEWWARGAPYRDLAAMSGEVDLEELRNFEGRS